MAEELILLDTSVLIDYFRKRKKEKTLLYELTELPVQFGVSIITEFEILIGSDEKQKEFWNEFFSKVEVIPYDRDANVKAVEIHKDLKKRNLKIEIPDLLIGATALSRGVKIATLNPKHFERIRGLELIGR